MPEPDIATLLEAGVAEVLGPGASDDDVIAAFS